MKQHLTILLLTSFCWLSVCAQKMPADYYEEGSKACEAGDYKTAVNELKYFTLNYPGDINYHNGICALSYAYYNGKMYDSAIRLCKQILTDTPIVEGRDYKSQRCAHCRFCRDYRSDQLAVDLAYRKSSFDEDRRRAEELLYKTYKAQRQYDSALKYLYKFDTAINRYGYRESMCGFGRNYSRDFFFNTLKYADMFELMGRYKEAEQTLILASFIWREDSVLNRLAKLLAKHEHIGHMQSELKQAVQHWESSAREVFYALPLYYNVYGAYIPFYGTKLLWTFAKTYDPYRPDETMLNADGTVDQEKMAQNYFYKWFMSLRPDGSYPPLPKKEW